MARKKEVSIFLAHATEDKPQARKLYFLLKEKGYQPWLDEEDLIPGQLWREEIPKAIQKSDIFIACLSKNSIRKQGYIQREFRMAINKFLEMPAGSIFLIPLRFDDCEIPDMQILPYGLGLRDFQWLDYWQPNGIDKLVKAIDIQKSRNYQGAISNSDLESLSKIGYDYDLVICIDAKSSMHRYLDYIKSILVPDFFCKMCKNASKRSKKILHLRSKIIVTVPGSSITLKESGSQASLQ
jgi:hypothetical protein